MNTTARPSYVKTFLDLSSSHVTWESRNRLDDGHMPGFLSATEYGWFLYVIDPDERGGTNLPEDIAAIFDLAHRLGCPYVMIDQDGEIVDELPTYDDDRKEILEGDRVFFRGKPCVVIDRHGDTVTVEFENGETAIVYLWLIEPAR